MRACLQCCETLWKSKILSQPHPITIRRCCSSKASSSSSSPPPPPPPLVLPPPSVIFSNHHLLVVDKPPGWRSIPLDANDYKSREDGQKCLLTHLQNQGTLGGGSLKDYLKPVHRLDQPCSGLTVFAKNSKAASRIQKAWAKRQVHKEYFCVVETTTGNENMDAVFGRAVPWEEFQQSRRRQDLLKPQTLDWGDEEWQDKRNVFVLSGLLQKWPHGKGSVWVKPVESHHQRETQRNAFNDGGTIQRSREALCHLEIRHLVSVSSNDRSNSRRQLSSRHYHLIAVRTVTGVRHQVRAMLSHIGKCPIVGDLRYGADSRNCLPDRSVALHARALYMPTVKLGGTEFLATEPFVAPIPTTWERYFGIRESDLRHDQ